MGTLKPGASIRYDRIGGILYGKYSDGESFIVGGSPVSVSRSNSKHITAIELDELIRNSISCENSKKILDEITEIIRR